VCAELDTEVEHAHNDWLQGFCELGLVGGGLLALGLALAARDGLRALADEERTPLALAALALLVNAFVHAPLSGNPAAGPLALAVFGCLLPGGPVSVGGKSRAWASLFSLPALLAFLFAPALITHGAALTEYIRSARRIDELASASQGDRAETAALLVGELERARAVVQIALAAAPDSAPARELAARTLRDETTNESRLAAWDRLLAVRPHSIEAWEQGAAVCVRAGRFAEARARLGHALQLSPTHPRLLKSAVRLELAHGEVESGLAWLERLRELGCLEPVWIATLGNELVLDLGLPERGARVLFGAPLVSLSAEDLHARSRAGNPETATGVDECLAQLLWAREHALAGAFELALRNYRQAARCSHAHRGSEAGPAALFTLELAAAEAGAGRREEAEARVRGVPLGSTTWAELPAWAQASLRELGLAQPE
jgi:tetratricopeptide (TPR) repeat protein